MKASLFISKIESSIPHLKAYLEVYLRDLNSRLQGFEVEIGETSEAAQEDLTLVMVLSGGPTAEFKKVYEATHGPYVFLTTPYDNSLACALELQTMVVKGGSKGEILFGSIDEIAQRLMEIVKAVKAGKKLSQMKFGVIGESANGNREAFDEDKLLKAVGTKTVYVPFNELAEEIKAGGYESTAMTRRLLENAPDKAEMEKALDVYGAVKRITQRYGFDAITLKCFDLLPMKITGCVALALINAEGMCAACEADARTLTSMVILNLVSGKPVFMANPVQADNKRKSILFAHCTLPLGMADSISFDTHFESGLSVAVKGVFKEGDFTVFKCMEDMKRYSAMEGTFVSSPSDPLQCRTQLELAFDGFGDFFTNPINNHRLICKGRYAKEIAEFFKWI